MYHTQPKSEVFENKNNGVSDKLGIKFGQIKWIKGQR